MLSIRCYTHLIGYHSLKGTHLKRKIHLVYVLKRLHGRDAFVNAVITPLVESLRECHNTKQCKLVMQMDRSFEAMPRPVIRNCVHLAVYMLTTPIKSSPFKGFSF